MSSPPFVHLHCHSHFSLLDGASPIDGLVDRAKALGMTGLALTDHGNLYGALDFYKKAKAAGINPILGYEAYIAPQSRFHKEAGGMKEASYHLTLLAQNRQGFKNLIKLASHAFLEGFYFKPRIDKELLAAHSEGIICLSGCVSGEFSRTLLAGRAGGAALAAGHGNRRLVSRASSATAISSRSRTTAWKSSGWPWSGPSRSSRRMGLPLVATSDAHYVNREDAEAQDVLLCINTGKFRTDKNRMRMEGDQFFLRSPDEMYAALPGYEEALQAKPGDRRQRRHRAGTGQAAFSQLHAAGRQDAARLSAKSSASRG